MRRLLALGLLLASVAAAGEPEVLSDDWHVMRLFGKDSGYVRTRVVRKGDTVETTVETNLVMKRAGAEMTVVQTETTEERVADGSIVRTRSVRKMSDYETEVDVRFEGTKAILVTKVAGQAREAAQTVEEGTVGPYRIDQLTRETGFKKGAAFDVKTYLAELGGATELAVTIGDEEEVELLDGKKEKLVRVETFFKKLGIKPLSWVDATGRVRKTRVSIAGMDMESILATEQRARGAAGKPGELPDSFARSLLAPLHPIPHPRRLDRATYRIRAKEGMPDLADGRQVIEKKEGDAILLRIDRQVPPDGSAARPIADTPAELAPCLAANSMVQSDAPEILAIAREVVGEERDAWKAAQKLERWVHDNITEKSMDVAFASALEVCRNRKGDCTEHAVLLCALSRAAGIPSRVTMGLVCIGNAFGGHAWTEVWIGGKWYALDGTLGHGSVDPTHITLTRMTLEDAAGAEAFLGLIQGLGNLEIDPVEVVLEGKTLRPGDAARIEGDRYESPLWGIAFTLPKEFKFDPPAAEASMSARIMQLDRWNETGAPCTIDIEATDAAMWEIVRSDKRFASFKEFTLDGRPALRGAKEDRRRVYALVADGVFVFQMDPVRSDADEKVFDDFLASVDFDVK